MCRVRVSGMCRVRVRVRAGAAVGLRLEPEQLHLEGEMQHACARAGQ